MNEEILLGYLQGRCSKEEEVRVESWCNESPQNRQQLEQLYYILTIDRCATVLHKTDTQAALKRFKSRLCNNRSSPLSHSPKKPQQILSVAALITGVLLMCCALWGISSIHNTKYTIITSAGQQAQTELPDGSKVWLNEDSRLTYHRSIWRNIRSVELTGEAYFEVQKDKKTPFIVQSKQIRTEVLGTKFNIRAKEEENKVITTLLEGSIRVETPQSVKMGEKYTLKPGQTINISTETQLTKLSERENPSEVLLWIEGKLLFKQHSLQEITRIMETLFDVNFIFQDETLKGEQFTGEFSTHSTPDNILNILKHTNHFKYQKEGNTFTLSR